MKNNKKLIVMIAIIVVLLIILGIALYFLLKEDNPIGPDLPNGKEPEEDGYASKVVVDTVPIINIQDKRDVRIEYPVLKSLTNESFQYSINTEITQNIEGYRKELDVMIDEYTPELALYKYIVSYKKYAVDDYLSLIISQDYQTGGMRSNKWKDIYNIDARNNRKIYLEDLFAANSNYKDKIIEEVNSQAENQNYELVGGNGLSNIPDRQKFYIKDKKLVIYFDPAEIAPYVYGELHFEMPFKYENGYFIID